jgi:endoglucanase
MSTEWKGVGFYGTLKVEGTKLLSQANRIVVLHGMSSHGMQWYPQFARTEGLMATKQAGANVFRVAMYPDEGGYLTNPAVARDVIRAVDDALALDMYAIIDWHILYDNDPMANLDKSLAFFDAMSLRYKNEPGVLYEICNEPNGSEVT